MKKILKTVCAALLLSSLMFTGVTAISKIGSRSDEVKEIQQALYLKGYYSSEPDGIFGTKTRAAVERFQKDNGLTVDGIVGEKTLTALGISSSDYDSFGTNSSDFELLARVISAEARGESYIGQVAVGAVILNRVEHPSFPDTLSGVIYQKNAFTCINDGQFYEPVADSAYSAARDALNGLDPSGGAVYYYNPSKSTSKWIFSRPVITTIGNHRFCE